MLRRHIHQVTGRLQPTIDRITSNPWIQRNFPALADPDLWHVNRRSAARAVAIGLFCGLIPGPFQALAAIVGCLVIRANFPIAVVTTLYTNPFTIVPLYLIAYEYGRLLFPDAPPGFTWSLPPSSGIADWLPALLHWMGALGKPLAVGLVMLAATLAAAGWIAVRLAWRCHAVWAWRRRARLRALAQPG
jgi:uncharacterized protein